MTGHLASDHWLGSGKQTPRIVRYTHARAHTHTHTFYNTIVVELYHIALYNGMEHVILK